IQLAPDEVEAYNELGYAYRRLHQSEAAIEIFTRSLKMKPDSAVPHFGLADVYFYNLQGYNDAIEQYRAGLSFNPKDGDAFRNLGAALNALAKYNEAPGPVELPPNR